MEHIVIRGAREHNLRNIDVSIPRDRLTVITGVSGSGKSTLAFDTLYAEGQRRYVESVSTYAKRFLERMHRPDVDAIEGLSPAVAIEQRNGAKSSRSTVGTVTEVHDYLRLLFARIGRTHCRECGEEVRRDDPESAARILLARADSGAGARVTLAFPLVVRDADHWKALLPSLLRSGYTRARLGDRDVNLEAGPVWSGREEGPAEITTDRLALRAENERRLVESLESTFREGDGHAVVRFEDGEALPLSSRFRCDRCGIDYPRLPPLAFSFNSPAGACPDCHGFGKTLDFALDLIIPDPKKTLAGGAIDPWAGKWRDNFHYRLAKKPATRAIPKNVAWEKLPRETRNLLLYGGPDFRGVLPFLARLKAKSYKSSARFLVKRYQRAVECKGCSGARLVPEALRVRVGGRTIADVSLLTVDRARVYVDTLVLTELEAAVSGRIREELGRRLSFLAEVGVGYLHLGRPAKTLSGGEAQRIELARALGSSLVGALYVLDEPTVGLHPRDGDRLIGVLRRLTRGGNTVVVVEHDRNVIAAADHVIDLGPGGGDAGGRLLFSGSLSELLETPGSLTGRYLAGDLGDPGGAAPLPARPRAGAGRARALRIVGATHRNLKNLTVELPLGKLVAVTGVSGSGKTSLVEGVLYANFAEREGREVEEPGTAVRIEGMTGIRKALFVDQSPIGKSPRSNPVTFVKAFDAIRKRFAATPLARERRYSPGTFSFNVKGGRCETCEGEGVTKVEMYFLADLYLECDACGGSRYRKEILDVRYGGKNVREVLDLTVDEAIAFFADAPEVGERLWVLARVGLGYLRLGQPSNTLSGGEAQRIKIARELGPGGETGVLYILDEPTVGLHFSEVDLLLKVLADLVRQGNSAIVIEHNLDFIARADWVVDLGPEGGDAGGRLVAEGTPETIAGHPDSYTGRFLRAWFEERKERGTGGKSVKNAASPFEKEEAIRGGIGRPSSDRLP